MSKHAKLLNSDNIIETRCRFLVSSIPQGFLDAVYPYVYLPDLVCSIPTHPPEPRGCIGRLSSVSLILSGGAWAEIANTIVQSIVVFVVNLCTLWKIKDVPMERDILTRLGSISVVSLHSLIENGIPVVSRQLVVARRIDDGLLPLGESDVPAWLSIDVKNFRADCYSSGIDAALSASARNRPFGFTAVRAFIVFICSTFGFAGRIGLRLVSLFIRQVHDFHLARGVVRINRTPALYQMEGV